MHRFSARSCVDFQSSKLCGITGAQKIIDTINSRTFVSRLVLGYNLLQDDGCEALFDFLCTEEGQRHGIVEISLNGNGIGPRGLLAICRYLNGNTVLQELFLQNNCLALDQTTVSTFAEALNNSILSKLALSTNTQLTDTFLSLFLSSLDTPHLQVLHLSAIGLTPLSTPVIIKYLSCRRSRYLNHLNLNGNYLGFSSVLAIIEAVEKHNHSLAFLEMFANCFIDGELGIILGQHQDTEPATQGATGDERTSIADWQQSHRQLNNILTRNKMSATDTVREAVALLKPARSLLLQSGSRGDVHGFAQALSPRLPIELQLYVLSFLAPRLSDAQRLRIYQYASDPGTLPPDPRQLPRLSRNIPSKSNSSSLLLPNLNNTSEIGSKSKAEERWRYLRVVDCVSKDPS